MSKRKSRLARRGSSGPPTLGKRLTELRGLRKTRREVHRERESLPLHDSRPGYRLIYIDKKEVSDPRILRGASSSAVTRIALYIKNSVRAS